MKLSVTVTRGNPVVSFFLFSSFLLTIARGAVIPFLAVYMTAAFGESITSAGFALSLSSIAGIVLSLYAGRLARAENAWLTVFVLLLLFLLSVFLGALSGEFVTLTILLIVMNFAYSCIEILLRTYISGQKDIVDKKKIFSANYFAVNMGWALGPLLGALVQSWQLNAIFYAGAFASLFPLVWLIIRTDVLRGFSIQQAENNDALSTDSKTIPRPEDLSSGNLFLLTLASFFGAFVYGNPVAYLSQHLVQHYSAQTASSIVALMMFTNAAVVLLFQHYIISKITQSNMLKFLMIATGCFVVGLIIFFHANEYRPAWIAGMFLFALGEVIFVPALFLITDLIAPAYARGSYFSVQNLGAAGAAVSPFVMGYILSTTDSIIAFGFLGMAIFFSFLLIYCMRINQPRLNGS
ncbi:MFS transporter [Brenneria rubrifaciens]|uniref:MFS transporter n=1 Tax=Brenneria rubrifaciens TaxID=55213 RepID=A0A4P8QVM7_9GAMM|nr:MFS transporter [Brenneria rubrifaciens]QCR07414.1 MFS transporter [Brenneria rubrifaciens]